MDNDMQSSPVAQTARYYAVYNGDEPVAFYHEATHGFRKIPQSILVGAEDFTQFPHVEWVMVDNPECKIPVDARPITVAEWDAYQEAQVKNATPDAIPGRRRP